MKTEIGITCICGHHIEAADVLQRGVWPGVLCPGCMFVRYRCSRCKRLRKQFIVSPLRAESVLNHHPTERHAGEVARFRAMGAIGMDEQVDFHYQLENHALPEVFPG